MPMIQGTCTVAADGTVTKTGGAQAVYDALVANLPDGITIPAGAEGVPIKKSLAKQALAVAALIPYITGAGAAKIAAAQGGLQLTPNPNNPDTATAGPGVDKFLALV
jgi:hypothetical protein